MRYRKPSLRLRLRLKLALGIGLSALAGPGFAQTVGVSPAPESIAIGIYREPDRDAARAIDLANLGGYALVTETRRVSIAAGDGVLRFEGVASGILPESAIVTGLPEGVVEKNQDANLLSPASLLGAATGRRVMLRRTSKATGQVREEPAVIRSGPQGQVVLQTAQGFEALRCTGIPETIVYDDLPAGLSAKPVLSVRTYSARAATATVTLSYLADRFDWQANYVATLRPDRRSLDLFAWVTLASGDETRFAAAQTLVIAGRVNRDRTDRAPDRAPPAIELTCWPSGTTSDVTGPVPPPPPSAMNAPMMMDMARAESITVTASRRKFAVQEDLGDLKLYRIPERVTVAARAQKQVALLERAAVPVRLVYRADMDGGDAPPVRLTVRARNRTADGLGLPLPAGKVALYQAMPPGAGGARPLLLGEGAVDDKAVGELVEIDVASATGVTAREVETAKRRRVLRVTNANAVPVAFEARFGDRIVSGSGLRRTDGTTIWAVTVPANGRATLSFNAD